MPDNNEVSKSCAEKSKGAYADLYIGFDDFVQSSTKESSGPATDPSAVVDVAGAAKGQEQLSIPVDESAPPSTSKLQPDEVVAASKDLITCQESIVPVNGSCQMEMDINYPSAKLQVCGERHDTESTHEFPVHEGYVMEASHSDTGIPEKPVIQRPNTETQKIPASDLPAINEENRVVQLELSVSGLTRNRKSLSRRKSMNANRLVEESEANGNDNNEEDFLVENGSPRGKKVEKRVKETVSEEGKQLVRKSRRIAEASDQPASKKRKKIAHSTHSQKKRKVNKEQLVKKDDEATIQMPTSDQSKCRMDKVCIYIAYNGKWTTQNKYLDHETKLALVNDDITFKGLTGNISHILKLKRGKNVANIWFDTKLETSKGMLVTDDEEVATCIYLLKNDPNFKTSRFIVDLMERNSLSASTSSSEEEEEDENSEDEGETDMDSERLEGLTVAEPLSVVKPIVILRENASMDEIVKGSMFEDKQSLKKCISKIAIENHFNFKVDKSTKIRYNLKCENEACSWCLHSSKVRDFALFKIYKFEKNHSCSVDVSKSASSKVLSDYVIELLRESKEEMKPKFVVEEMKKRYGLDISYNKAWRALQLAHESIRERSKENSKLLLSDPHMMKERTPETETNLSRDDEQVDLLIDSAPSDGNFTSIEGS